MAQLDFPRFEQTLKAFDFPRLFTEVLGWNAAPNGGAWTHDSAGSKSQTAFEYRTVSELGGVVALQVVVSDNGVNVWPSEEQRLQVWKHIANSYTENLLIFTDQRAAPSQSQWYWVKRDKHPDTGKPRLVPRRHEYFRGQPVELFASKLQGMVVELSELDATGRIPVLEAARRIANALDVEKTTKKFFTAYQQQHINLLSHIHGIANERDKRWYASVLLNRLMFVWFMQKKGFLDHANYDYLSQKLASHKTLIPTQVQPQVQAQTQTAQTEQGFYATFLNALFFEAFAKPEQDRSAQARTLTGQIPYLNGGLFLHHKLELDTQGESRVGKDLQVDDAAFQGIFQLFASFTWHLDDTPGGSADEINPDVLGYIFEKYINQKAFGAYYTRPEITGYLAERSIHQLILERINSPAYPELGIKAVQHATVPDMLARMDSATALTLVKQVLPTITILDPSVGSGAFLVAALKVMMNVYYAVVGRAELGVSSDLEHWLKSIQKNHPSVGYYIKRRIVTDNLHGVDIMEEACEIAKLRLFLAMVASVRRVQDLEPLPNIDFNILPGNSLVGLMRVDAVEFNQKNTQLGLFTQVKPRSFTDLLAEKNRLLKTYRDTAQELGKSTNLRSVRDELDHSIANANGVMNELLRDQFEAQGVKYEQATWDAAKAKLGKSIKQPITRAHIDAQTPFHWGYVFDDIVQTRGGFDIVLANPPWEVFQTNEKEFFQEYDRTIQKKTLRIEDWESQFDTLMLDRDIQDAWLAYISRFPHTLKYFKTSPEYAAATQEGGKPNLYMLFVERCFGLLRQGGHCGIVIPSGIYTDLGTKGLRELLFEKTQIQGLFCFENRKEIFEGVHRSFKFVVLTLEKSKQIRLLQAGERNASAAPKDLLADQAIKSAGGGGTVSFPAAFMRHEVTELERFPQEGAVWIETGLVKQLSPDSLSIIEFTSEFDIAIASKANQHPALLDSSTGWGMELYGEELNMTRSANVFIGNATDLPVYEGGMIWQFDAKYADARYFVPKAAVADSFRVKRAKRLDSVSNDAVLRNDYECYRIALRKIASNTNERTLIASILPKNSLAGNSLTVHFPHAHLASTPNSERFTALEILFITAVINSFTLDFLLRARMTTNLNLFYLYQLPLPRLSANDPRFAPIARRAALLTCTSPEFDDLAIAAGLTPSPASGTGAGGEGAGKHIIYGTTDPAERAKLRAELDGLVAHLYGLTEAEFVHILGTFPIVPDPVKIAAHNAYRDVARGLVV
jgi:hypothetical protein